MKSHYKQTTSSRLQIVIFINDLEKNLNNKEYACRVCMGYSVIHDTQFIQLVATDLELVLQQNLLDVVFFFLVLQINTKRLLLAPPLTATFSFRTFQ